MNYGIANRSGKPQPSEAQALLSGAWNAGVRFFDTAQAYGDSEKVLGLFFSGLTGSEEARVATKLDAELDITSETAIRATVEASIARLHLKRLWGLYLHRENLLDRWDSPLGRAMRGLKRDGLVENVGVSVYDPSYALKALANDDVTIVQAPANVFDRRMLRSKVDVRAEALGKTLLIRSVFLQGLIFLHPKDAAQVVDGAEAAVERFSAFVGDRRLGKAEFAYDYIRLRFPKALILMGAESLQQVESNLRMAKRAPMDKNIADAWDAEWSGDLDRLVNPPLWNKR